MLRGPKLLARRIYKGFRVDLSILLFFTHSSIQHQQSSHPSYVWCFLLSKVLPFYAMAEMKTKREDLFPYDQDNGTDASKSTLGN
jgi:hypothetical protein